MSKREKRALEQKKREAEIL